MKRIFFPLFALLLFVWVKTAAQQNDSIPTETAAIIQHGSMRLDSVQRIDVVSIVYHTTEKQTSSTGCYIRSEETASKNYGTDITSALAISPSVIATNESGIGIGNTSIRLRGADGKQLKVTMNGVEMNNPDSHEMYWYDTPDLISSVGTIMIQRGAGISTHGADVFGGAVEMNSHAIAEEFNGSASLSYGSYNTNKQAVSISSGKLGEHWALDARLSHIASDGYIDRAATDLKSYLFQGAYFNNDQTTRIKLISFGGKARTYLSYNGATKEEMARNGRRYNSSGMYQTKDAYSHRVWNSEDGEWQQVNYYPDQTDNYLQINNQLNLQQHLTYRWSMDATAFYTYGYGYYEQYKDKAKLYEYLFPENEAFQTDDSGKYILNDNGEKIPLRRDLVRQKLMRNHYGGINLMMHYIAPRFSATFGGKWSYYASPHWGELDWMQSEVPATFKRGMRWYDNDVNKQDASIFGRTSWHTKKGLSLFADLQYRFVRYKTWGSNDNYDSRTETMQPIDVSEKYHFFYPRIMVSYQLTQKHFFFFSFALAYKEPTRNDFTDRYLFSENNLKPQAERLCDYELGYQFSVPKLTAYINFYYMKYKDQLVHTGMVNDSADALNVNVPESYRRGMELSVTWEPLRWLDISANATFSQNRIQHYVDALSDSPTFGQDLGTKDISYSPSAMGGLHLRFHYKGFEALLDTQAIGKQYLTNNENEALALDRYCVTNLDLSYTLHTNAVRSIRFGLAVYNLLDAKYCSNGYGYSYMDTWSGNTPERIDRAYYFAQAPLNVLANVTVKF